MKLTLNDKTVRLIVKEANTKNTGYNGAWLDGYRYLASLLGIVKFDYDKGEYIAWNDNRNEKGNN